MISALRYEDLEMPPEEPLPENVIQNFERWVRMGAPDPRDGVSVAPQPDDDPSKALLVSISEL